MPVSRDSVQLQSLRAGTSQHAYYELISPTLANLNAFHTKWACMHFLNTHRRPFWAVRAAEEESSRVTQY